MHNLALTNVIKLSRDGTQLDIELFEFLNISLQT